MREIIEHFGFGFLAVLAVAGMMRIYVGLLDEGGILYRAVSSFMCSICG